MIKTIAIQTITYHHHADVKKLKQFILVLVSSITFLLYKTICFLKFYSYCKTFKSLCHKSSKKILIIFVRSFLNTFQKRMTNKIISKRH